MPDKIKVLYVASEAKPFIKSGGLADVAGSLPKELRRRGADVRLVIPKYKNINEKFLVNSEYVNTLDISLGWRRQKADVYRIASDEMTTYLIGSDYYFGRDGLYGYGDDHEKFAFFTKAAIECLMAVEFAPDIIHFNDWQTGLGCVYLKDIYRKFLLYKNVRTLYTIHNLQYQGVFPKDILESVDINGGYFVGDKLEFYGAVSFMKAGLTYADAINAVSPTYALEIQSPFFGYRLDGMLRSRKDSLYGILNGIDETENNPETDKRIRANYDAKDIKKGDFTGKTANKTSLQRELGLPVREDVPIISVISRLVDQKGMNILLEAMDGLLGMDVQLVILGTGDWNYEQALKTLAWRRPDKLSVNTMFNEDLSYRIYAASDMFLMPSLFEPCGLGQMIAMRYGAIPVVRKTGGLSDTVKHYDSHTRKGNGFVFEDYLASGILWAVGEALKYYHDKNEWKNIVSNAMTSDFSWRASADKYMELYKKLKES